MDLSIIVLVAFAVLFQFSAAYFVYRIHKFNRLAKWSPVLVLAFVLQGISTLRMLSADMNLAIITQDLFFDRGLLFLVSLFICIGLWGLMRNFESFDVISKNVKDKLSKFKE